MRMKYALIALLCFALIAILLIADRCFTAEPEPISEPERDWSGLKAQQMVAQPEPSAEPEIIYDERVPLSKDLQEALTYACQAHGVEYALALGLIQAESNFDINAVSYSGCYGLCQLNPVYFPANLTPAENIEHGIAYLAREIAYYGDIAAGLTAYHAGHDDGTRGYASVVLRYAAEWRARLDTEEAY